MSVELISDPIDVPALLAACSSPECGAVSLFLGVVRNHHQDHAVDYLDYEAYPTLALKVMQDIVDRAQRRWSMPRVMLVHRIGRLHVGDVSVAVAVATPHRNESYEASRFIIDTVKSEVPIWKREVGPDGHIWIEGGDIRPALQ